MTLRNWSIFGAVCDIFLLGYFGAGHFLPDSPGLINPTGTAGHWLAWVFGFLAAMSLLNMWSPKVRPLRVGLLLGSIGEIIAVYFFQAVSKGQSGGPISISYAGALIFAVLSLIILMSVIPGPATGEEREPTIDG